jgi:hypothetical protein
MLQAAALDLFLVPETRLEVGHDLIPPVEVEEARAIRDLEKSSTRSAVTPSPAETDMSIRSSFADVVERT